MKFYANGLLLLLAAAVIAAPPKQPAIKVLTETVKTSPYTEVRRYVGHVTASGSFPMSQLFE